jgi:hypothetical protein
MLKESPEAILKNEPIIIETNEDLVEGHRVHIIITNIDM